MSTYLHSERDAFNAFLDGRLGKIHSGLSLEDALTEFRAYQRELADARTKVREAKAAGSRGESAELDVDQLMQEVRNELASEGIRE